MGNQRIEISALDFLGQFEVSLIIAGAIGLEAAVTGSSLSFKIANLGSGTL